MKLFAAGISHKTAPVELRERFAVPRSELVDVARALKSLGKLDEVVLPSTCNRVEIYGRTQSSLDINSLFRFLSSEEPDPHIYVHEDVEAARHLFRVTAGLDSMMLGETEIIGQIKNAYETARQAELTGPVLNRLFQKAFQVTKEIRTRTAIGRSAVSIKSAGFQLMKKFLGREATNKSVMVIGAGQMAERYVQSLVSKGVRSIFVSSRSFDRAIDLATRCGGKAVRFGDCLFEMRNVDVVITATTAETLVNREDMENVMKARRQRRLLLIDLSVPRNIDPAVGRLQNVSLYNIDHLEATARQGVQARERELAACRQIIDTHVAPLFEKLRVGTERLHVGQLGASHNFFELTKNRKLPRASGLVLQPIQEV